MNADGNPLAVNVSIGSSWIANSVSVPDDMIEQADLNMYRVKLNHKAARGASRSLADRAARNSPEVSPN